MTTKKLKIGGRTLGAGRKRIGDMARVRLTPAQEAYALSIADNLSLGVRACIDRCRALDADKPIDWDAEGKGGAS